MTSSYSPNNTDKDNASSQGSSALNGNTLGADKHSLSATQNASNKSDQTGSAKLDQIGSKVESITSNVRNKASQLTDKASDLYTEAKDAAPAWLSDNSSKILMGVGALAVLGVAGYFVAKAVRGDESNSSTTDRLRKA